MDSLKKCEICGLEASCLCLKCLMYFCENCYKFIHEKELNNKHEKEKIDYFAPIDTKCAEHPNNKIELFCLDEKGKQNNNYLFIY